MKIYKAAIIGLGPSGLAINKLIYGAEKNEIIAFDHINIQNRNNYFGFWLTDWMKPYEGLVEKKWYSWEISNTNTNISHTDNDYPYCVISFKTWKEFCLSAKNKLNIISKKVTQYHAEKNYYKIITEDNEEYFAEKIYDSRSEKIKNSELMQHFFGINIITPNNTFNDNKLTLMHFTENNDVLHFIYVLPFAHNKALIESTVFSKKTFKEEWYRDKINKYLQKKSITEFREYSNEKGIIPMYFTQEKNSNDKNIFNVGIRGGACKSSTGYAFCFLIKQIQLLKNSNKNHVEVHKYLEKKMDKIFLNYLNNNNENGITFINLCKNLNGREFQNFMMGQSTILTKFKIIKSMPKLSFIKAVFN